jgi:rhodanese-related sulfurtransferase
MLGKPGCTQVPEDRPYVVNPEFDQKISATISFTIPTKGVQEVWKQKDEVYLLDTREREEYQVSHIEGATYLGYKNPDYTRLEDIPKDAEVVLYCSIGYRSEKIAEELRKRGYQNVYNLYGSIFEWVNQGYPVVDEAGNVTDKIHTYNRNWSKWVDEQQAKKVW